MPEDNPSERQPFFGVPNRNNRVYVPAEWADSGSWTGSPKISGGTEISRNTGVPAPRGLNRTDQRYQLPAGEAQSRRAARAAAEYSSMYFLVTELDRFEVQSASGKTLDAVPLVEQAFVGADGELHMCQCEDDWRLRESGYTFATVCKHVIALRTWLLETHIDDRWFGLEYVAEATGFSLRALERRCQENDLPADKIGRQWAIPPSLIGTTITYLNNLKIQFPEAIGE